MDLQKVLEFMCSLIKTKLPKHKTKMRITNDDSNTPSKQMTVEQKGNASKNGSKHESKHKQQQLETKVNTRLNKRNQKEKQAKQRQTQAKHKSN